MKKEKNKSKNSKTTMIKIAFLYQETDQKHNLKN
jgi:hypothetical protein